MEAIRIKIVGITSSFRNPNFVSGAQPTLDVPPPSTVLGIISAAVGRIVTSKDVKFGYVFLYETKGEDLELIYELTIKEKYKAKSNVILREFLFSPELYVYIDDLSYEKYFIYPEFPLLLGRTQEIAKVEEIKKVMLEKASPVRFGHTVVPFDFKGVAGALVALPLYFEYSFMKPRVGRKIQPFVVVNRFIQYTYEPIFYDQEKNWGVYFYGV